MKILEFIYDEKSISFNPTGNDNVMVNATEIANIFGKRIDFFLKAEHVSNFIEELMLPPNGGSPDDKMRLNFPRLGEIQNQCFNPCFSGSGVLSRVSFYQVVCQYDSTKLECH